jgi:hypothetical protein
MSNLNIGDSFLDSYKKIFEPFAGAVPQGPEPEDSLPDNKENSFFSSGAQTAMTAEPLASAVPLESDQNEEDDFLSSGDQTAMTNEQLNDFQKLLSNLEASKKRQQQQKFVEGRRDVYAQGLASMMSNF